MYILGSAATVIRPPRPRLTCWICLQFGLSLSLGSAGHCLRFCLRFVWKSRSESPNSRSRRREPGEHPKAGAAWRAVRQSCSPRQSPRPGVGHREPQRYGRRFLRRARCAGRAQRGTWSQNRRRKRNTAALLWLRTCVGRSTLSRSWIITDEFILVAIRKIKRASRSGKRARLRYNLEGTPYLLLAMQKKPNWRFDERSPRY